MRSTFNLIIVVLIRAALTLLLIVSLQDSVGQTLRKHIKVINSTGATLQFVTLKYGNTHTFTNAAGVGSVETSMSDTAALLLQREGYLSKSLLHNELNADTTIVVLATRVNMLTDARVVAKRIKTHLHVLGKKVNKLDGSAYLTTGAKYGMFLTNRTSKDGFLNSVFVYITNEGDPTASFRVRIYSEDTVNGKPAVELSDSNVVVHGNRGNEWVSADFSAQLIKVGGGIFVIIELIASENQRHFPVTKAGCCYFCLCSNLNGILSFNGMVLGLTYKYGNLPLSYSKRTQSDNWIYSNLSFSKGTRMHQMNPMIYATFN